MAFSRKASEENETVSKWLKTAIDSGTFGPVEDVVQSEVEDAIKEKYPNWSKDRVRGRAAKAVRTARGRIVRARKKNDR